MLTWYPILQLNKKQRYHPAKQTDIAECFAFDADEEKNSRHLKYRQERGNFHYFFWQKPGKKGEPKHQLHNSLHLQIAIDSYLVDQYLETNRNPDAPGYYISWLCEKVSVFAYPFEGTWFDIGDLNSYQKADQYFRTRGESRKR